MPTLTSRELSIKAMSSKARSGDFPGCAPTGYLNHTDLDGTKRIVVDLMLGPLVQEAFVLVAGDAYPLREVLSIMNSKGLVSRRGGPFSVSAFWYMLKNPFNIGKLVWNGETIQGSHPALVSEELFQKVGEVIAARARRKV